MGFAPTGRGRYDHAGIEREVVMLRKVLPVALAVVLWTATSAAQNSSRNQDQKPAAITESAPRSAADAKKSKTGVVVLAPVEDGFQVADEGGQIYTARGYRGVVPGVRDQSDVAAKRPENEAFAATRAIVEWVGFQPFPTYSRVFIQVSGRFAFAVTRPRPDRIEVRIPGADMSTPNDSRRLVTRDFPTSVDLVEISEDATDGAIVVTISLKRPVGYLYRQEGRYVFIDIEP
jgi:hypothetical protein